MRKTAMLRNVLNTGDPRPAYLQIADVLRGAYVPGEKLDSTDALAAKWNVAKQTIRAAIDELRKEKLVVSWQGRGVFYSDSTDVDSASADQILDRIMNRLDDFEERLTALEQQPRGPATE